jgi:hypothetical protein
MIDYLARLSRQPEYIHVLLNPLPIYGLAVGVIGVIVALFLRSRPAQIATLILVLISAASAWPVYEFGEQGYDRVVSMTDDDGHAWLDEHQHRAEHLIAFFYVLAAIAAIAIVAPTKWPRTAVPLALIAALLGAVVLGMGGYIGYAGGKVRHKEFRTGPPPAQKMSRSGQANEEFRGAQAASLSFAAACREPLET